MASLKKQLKKFQDEMQGNILGGLLLFHLESKFFIVIEYGDGSDLTPENEEDGYDDYICFRIDTFEHGEWTENLDGGKMLLKMGNLSENYNICNHVEEVLDLMGVKGDVVILKGFSNKYIEKEE